MSKILAVCHSVGDTQVILESAKEMAKNAIHTSILVVGSAAKTKVEAYLKTLNTSEEQSIFMLDIDEKLPEIKPISKNISILDENSIEQLSEKIKLSEYAGLLIGTPSYAMVDKQCDIPEQLLTQWGKTLPSAVVSDYAFYDPQHHIVTHSWFKNATKFLVPFAKAKEAFGQTENTNTIVVGHPTVDAAKKLYRQWVLERKEELDSRIETVKSNLKLQPDQKFIFVAGGKAGDEAMIQALAQTCKSYPKIQIFLGMHPAAETSYLSAIEKLIENCEQIRFMPKNISTDEAVYVANGVITVSSMVGTTASACTKLAAFYQEDKLSDDISIPFIVADSDLAQFCSTPNDFLPFYKRVMERSAVITESDLVSTTSASENIANEMQSLVKMTK